MLMMQVGQDPRRVCAFWTGELDVFLGKIFLYQQHKETFGLPRLENKETIFLCLEAALLP